MFIQFVKFKSGLSEDQARQVMEERAPQFRALPGLLQKYYVCDTQTGEYAGIYVWDSEESMNEFRQSELAKSIPMAYQAQGQPRIELLDVLMPLRERALEPASAD
ncbi:MAG: YdhR family protein [Dehalococcoidia bacterium]